MPHTLQGKNKLDRNIHLNRNISEVKSPAGSLCREERKRCTHTHTHTHTRASETWKQSLIQSVYTPALIKCLKLTFHLEEQLVHC